ncbi:galactose-specific lectin nattectin-like [Ostrea edulis]|uniref:galactose-specific lectin nattectin-like n=1 Tax=Ostrea edulis TaxID=37623 RepID=UPI0024AF5339|nr:galactose-specific lectin nattectin-like [Ostrea edulis]
MSTEILGFVFFVFCLQVQIGFSQPLGIKRDDERCIAEDYTLNIKSYLKDELSDLEKRLKKDFSKNIQNLKTQINRLTNCPRGWSKHGTSCYKLNKRKSTWKTADQFCRGLSGKLAEIGTKSENDFIKNLIKNNSGTERAWLGGADTAEEGTWIWSFSEIPLSFKNWNKGEPNDDKGKEDCLEILGTQNGLWNDLPCSYSSASVCEKDL